MADWLRVRPISDTPRTCTHRRPRRESPLRRRQYGLGTPLALQMNPGCLYFGVGKPNARRRRTVFVVHFAVIKSSPVPSRHCFGAGNCVAINSTKKKTQILEIPNANKHLCSTIFHKKSYKKKKKDIVLWRLLKHPTTGFDGFDALAFCSSLLR